MTLPDVCLLCQKSGLLDQTEELAILLALRCQPTRPTQSPSCLLTRPFSWQPVCSRSFCVLQRVHNLIWRKLFHYVSGLRFVEVKSTGRRFSFGCLLFVSLFSFDRVARWVWRWPCIEKSQHLRGPFELGVGSIPLVAWRSKTRREMNSGSPLWVWPGPPYFETNGFH